MKIEFFSCYTGHIDKMLMNSGLHYHHLGSCFRLLPNGNTHMIKARKFKEKEDFESYEVVVCKGEYRIDDDNIVFHGSLDEFKDWLEQFKMKSEFYGG